MVFVLIYFYDSLGLVKEASLLGWVATTTAISLSMYATSKRAAFIRFKWKLLLMLSVSMYLSWYIANDYKEENAEYMMFFFLAPIFLLGLFIIPSWLELSIVGGVFIFLVGLWLKLFKEQSESFSLYTFAFKALFILLIYTVIFSLFEKARKE